MKRSIPIPVSMMRQSMVAAVVLGTALSTLQTTLAAGEAEDTLRAVGDISRYCNACWRNARLPPDTWSDCTHDVFLRLLERMDVSGWKRILQGDAEERHEFFRAVDAVKKRVQRQHRYAALIEEAVVDHRQRADRRQTEERAAVEQVAGLVLGSRQQHILQRSFEGASVQAIADELDLPAERVSDEKYKAIRKLRQILGTNDAS